MVVTIKELELKANQIRLDIINMLVEAGSGHSAGPLGVADIFTALYFHTLKHDPGHPDWPDRDIVVLSNGHIVPVRYATMAHAGYLPKQELMSLRKLGSRLQGHPERTRLPGMETTSGPLGSGLSQAIGMALVLQREENTRRRVYCLTSDGEINEGNYWEAVMFGAKYKVPITVIVDRNNIQIDGPTEQIMPLEDLSDKWEAFNWHVIEIDGHNTREIITACDEAKTIVEKPVVIIAHTIPGKGVDFMEYDYRWHGMPPGSKDIPGDPPKSEQVKEALKQLRTLGGKIRSEHE